MGSSMWNTGIRESQTLANRGTGNYLMWSLFMYILNLTILCFYLALSCALHFLVCCPYTWCLTPFFLSRSTMITLLVTQSSFPSSLVLLVHQPRSNWHRGTSDHLPTGLWSLAPCKNRWIQLVIDGVIPGTGQNHCPLSIVAGWWWYHHQWDSSDILLNISWLMSPCQKRYQPLCRAIIGTTCAQNCR